MMRRRDLALALLVVVIWGANFTVIKIGLNELPALLLVALRFALTAIPAVFFVRRPAVPARYWIGYGAMTGLGQFGLLFIAMAIGMPAGAASVVAQSQAFFTLLFAGWFLHEKISPRRIVGVAIGGLGLALVGVGAAGGGRLSIPLAALVLMLASSAFWALANVLVRVMTRRAARDGQMLSSVSLVAWGALVAPLPLAAVGVLTAPTGALGAVARDPLVAILAVLFLSYLATLFAFGIWSRLLTRYDAVKVAPLSLLVPVVGLVIAWLVLGERLDWAQWIGSVTVIAGLVIATFERRFSPGGAACQGDADGA